MLKYYHIKELLREFFFKLSDYFKKLDYTFDFLLETSDILFLYVILYSLNEFKIGRAHV